MVEAVKENRSRIDWIWGRMSKLSVPSRVAALLFQAAAIVSMSFCQLGFWPIGTIDAKPVYLLLLLGPLVLGAIMTGPALGALLGLFAGAVVFLHATFIALDFYEVYFMTVLNTFVLLTAVGFVAGLLFQRVLRSDPQGIARLVRISLVCFALSFAVSGLVQVNTLISYMGFVDVFSTAEIEHMERISEILLNSPAGVVVQALVDAVLMTVLCWMADLIVRDLGKPRGNRTLLSTFSMWMLLVSATVVMLTSAVVFSIATLNATDFAEKDMLTEVEYFERQIRRQTNPDFDAMLDGYDLEFDGTVAITDKNGIILASDDPVKFAKGESALVPLGFGELTTRDKGGEEFFKSFLADGNRSGIFQATDENGDITMEFSFVVFGTHEGGFIVMQRTSSMVYEGRLGTMAAMTLLAIVLIGAIAVVAAVLLRHLIVYRIDETNDALDKITRGNLNERVRVNDSREFISLSAGINTTVTALSDTIEEVKQLNAQDLATAKVIQESALPRDFPPFPQIDKFDIYASMKTAKEVGGDFYDFFLVGDENDRLGFVMADVSGKGIPAALFMMTAKSQIRNYMEAGLPVGEAINAANHQLCIGNDAGMFVTVWVGILNFNTGFLSYVNCGHNPPLLLHDGAWEWVKDVSGMPLGLFDGIPYESYSRQLEPRDVLYLYTDGVTEAMDVAGNLFGEERLVETLGFFGDMNSRSVGVGVRRALTDFTKDAEQSDDITMLILKYGVPPEKKAIMVLPAVDTQLVHVYNYIHGELYRRNAPKSVYNPLDIAAEELFVNVCHYAYPNATPDDPGEVRIGFEYESNPPSLTVTISDDGVAYNPLAKPDAVTPDDIADVPIGGLGILMAKRSVDDMTYERVGDSNVLTFVKHW